MFYSISQAENACESDPSLIFQLIKAKDKEIIERIINKEKFNFNMVDNLGNNVIMSLLKNKNYDLVLKYIDKVDINHQNNEGDSIMHMLASTNYLIVREMVDSVLNNKNINLNLKNSKGETILDKAIKSNYLCTTIKILEQDSFESIDIYSFKKLYDTYIKSDNYGAYSKLSNLEVILDSIENKKLIPKIRKLVYLIENNKNKIEDDFMKMKTGKIDRLINRVIKEVVN
ncbi:MAG: hypothetical protein IKN63_01885 [Bacilli bacterium]|nr:hypothetical protein [Bacilli bacterium]